jgi:ankyrin repeat protein
VKLLIDRGSPVNEPDARGRTPLMLVMQASVDSFWTNRRSLESIEALLRAGASVDGVPVPSGWDEADELLRRHGKGVVS